MNPNINEKSSTKNQNADRKYSSSDDEIYCGVGSCRPQILQKCRTMSCFTATYGVAGIITSALQIYINSQISTLERHFNFSSGVSGFLMSCNELGYMSTTLFMSYYTRRVHVPRSMALCTFLYGLSGLFCTVAFFGTRDQIPSPPKDAGGFRAAMPVLFTQTCMNTAMPSNTSCADNTNKPKAAFEVSATWRILAICILAIGMILQGVAKSPRHPFLGTYVDDNVPKTKTSLYLGIITGLSIFGPALAFGIGGMFSSMYITLEETNISPRDPRWMGAWWLGFLVFGGCGIICSVPLIFFPRRLRRQERLAVITHKKNTDQRRLIRCLFDFKDFLKSMFRLLRNPVYACVVLGTCTTLIAVSGLLAFMAKYLERQYTVTAKQANLSLGAINVLAASLGTIFGGCLTSKLKLSPVACLKMLIGCVLASTAFVSTGFFLGCDQPVIHTGFYKNSSGGSVSRCVQDCNCDGGNFFPVCGEDGRNYFSPCHAGCLSVDKSIFTNCSCLASPTTTTAKGGLCVPDCNKMIIYLGFSFLEAFTTTMTVMPSFIVSVRSVKEVDKPLAIGFSAFASTLLGWFPGPVIFGNLIDTTCLLWKKTCTSVGACTLYDIELFRFRFHGLIVGLRIATVILFTLALTFAVCSKKTHFQPHLHENPIIQNPKDSEKNVEMEGTEIALMIKD
ncbi:hypothetical protein BsWGS_14289 [Bradybaena similaris]